MKSILRTNILILSLFLGLISFAVPTPTKAYCEQFFIISCSAAHPAKCPYKMGGGMTMCCDTQAECAAQDPFCYFNGNIIGVRSALGCLQSGNAPNFMNQLVRWAIGLSGLAAFGLIIYSSVTMATAQGDLKRVTLSKDILTAAIMGMVLIVTAVILLNFIGVTVLGLDVFGFKI